MNQDANQHPLFRDVAIVAGVGATGVGSFFFGKKLLGKNAIKGVAKLAEHSATPIITDAFKDAVKENDVRLLRIMMKNSLLVDTTHSEFNQMMKLTKKVSGLMDVHDGEKLNHDASVWTKDYMDNQMAQSVYNFSPERIDLLKNMTKKLYGNNK